jgi:Tfp pilus assembly protein PilN
MQELFLDYQARFRQADHLDRRLLIGALLVSALLGGGYAVLSWQIEALDTSKSEYQQQASPRGALHNKLNALSGEQLRNEIKQANEVLTRLALPWEALFRDLDAAQQDRVALLSIVPDPQQRTVKVSGEAKNFTALLDYVRMLQTNRSLTGVYLQSHRIEEQMAEKPVYFSVVAGWAVAP